MAEENKVLTAFEAPSGNAEGQASKQSETAEADELLKEFAEDMAEDAGAAKDAPAADATYELTFSSQVDVFKKQ